MDSGPAPRGASRNDVEFDAAPRISAIRSPVLVMWSAQGPLDNWYAEGPVTLWRDWADDVTGYPLKGGHFFPEAAPEQTADAPRRFFTGSGRRFWVPRWEQKTRYALFRPAGGGVSPSPVPPSGAGPCLPKTLDHL